MTEHLIRRAGTLIAAVLAVDGLVHLYWSTGLTWPAADSRSLSFAVLGFPVPFTPGILLPLAATLFGAALLVRGRVTLGRRHRLGWLLQAGTVAVTAGLLVRALAGLVWACGVGVRTDTAFYWLNLFAYTPACLGLGVAAVTVVRYDAKGPLLVALHGSAAARHGGGPTARTATPLWSSADTGPRRVLDSWTRPSRGSTTCVKDRGPRSCSSHPEPPRRSPGGRS